MTHTNITDIIEQLELERDGARERWQQAKLSGDHDSYQYYSGREMGLDVAISKLRHSEELER